MERLRTQVARGPVSEGQQDLQPRDTSALMSLDETVARSPTRALYLSDDPHPHPKFSSQTLTEPVPTRRNTTQCIFPAQFTKRGDW